MFVQLFNIFKIITFKPSGLFHNGKLFLFI